MQIDLIITGGRILTLAGDDPTAHGYPVTALAVHDGRVLAVDGLDGLTARRTIDLGGSTLVPGFGDAHNHMAWYGLGLDAIDLSAMRDHHQLYDAIARRARELAVGEMVTGTGYDDNILGGHPDIDELDRAAAGREVWLTHRSGHMCVVNTPLLERVGLLDDSAAVPEGGLVAMRDGRPTGLLQEQAQTLVTSVVTPYPVETLHRAIARAGRQYASEGLTHVTECGIGAGWLGKSPVELAAYQSCSDAGELWVRVQLMPAISALHDVDAHADDAGFGLDLGLRTGFGDDALRIGATKIWIDGSLIGRTAALSDPYEGRSGDPDKPRGYLQDDPARMHQQIVAAHRAGWAVAAHAIGDAAIDFALDVFEDAQTRYPRPGVRHRIEHAALTTTGQVQRMAALGVTPVPQSRFIHDIGDSMAAAVGPQRTTWLYRHRSFLNAGCRVPGSSDRPVAAGAPLLGMASMIERLTAGGAVLGTDETVGALTALRAYTVENAWIAGEESRRGRLAPGHLADFVVIDRDITTSTPQQIATTTVLATARGGHATYDTGLGLPRDSRDNADL